MQNGRCVHPPSSRGKPPHLTAAFTISWLGPRLRPPGCVLCEASLGRSHPSDSMCRWTDVHVVGVAGAAVPPEGVPVPPPYRSPGSARPGTLSLQGAIWRWRVVGQGRLAGWAAGPQPHAPLGRRANAGVLCRHPGGAVSGWSPSELCPPGPASCVPHPLPGHSWALGCSGEMRAGSHHKLPTQVQASGVDDHVGTWPQGSRVRNGLGRASCFVRTRWS